MMKVAISGLRHGHIASVIHQIQKHPELTLTGVAESSPGECTEIIEAAGIQVTHPSLDALLAEVDFDILGIGDVYKYRGAAAIKALKAGKHVVIDKPLCTELTELDEIDQLVKGTGLSIMAYLTLRYQPGWKAARKALRNREIGEILTVAVFGRHPLNYRNGRPDWYFAEGLHGGTLNDLGIHGVDGLEWLTGMQVVEVIAARAWNQSFDEVAFFQNGAQAMLGMTNGAGVIMDVSYSTPPGCNDGWTLHFYGTEGDLLLQGNRALVRRTGGNQHELVADPEDTGNTLDDLMAEITGTAANLTITTKASLRAARMALTMQYAADQNKMHVPMG